MPAETDLFASPVGQWQPLSRRHLHMKLTLILIVWPVLVAAATLLARAMTSADWVWWAVPGAGLLVWVWRLLRAPRAYRRWGYAETDTDVHLTRGLAWRSLVCVPYGRMQLVNVNAGPLQRMFKLASVEMVTASTSGSISIPGLDPAAAQALRDRLVDRGEELQAGI